MPFSKTERYTFTQLDNPPDYLAVPYGEAFDISLSLAANSESKPTMASARFGLQPERNSKIRGGKYTFTFPGQQESGTIAFRVGDLRHSLRIEPMQRPVVLATRVKVKSPDYMGIPERMLDLGIGEISAVEGSELVFEMDTSRPLRSGSYGPTSISGENPETVANIGKFNPSQDSLSLSGTTARTGVISVGVFPFEIPFSWTDEFGLSGGQDYNLRVDAVPDTPPVSYTQGLERQKAILPEETLDFDILCEDDFGLRETGIEWESFGTVPGVEAATKGELVIATGGPEQRRLMDPVAFSPAAFGLGRRNSCSEPFRRIISQDVAVSIRNPFCFMFSAGRSTRSC